MKMGGTEENILSYSDERIKPSYVVLTDRVLLQIQQSSLRVLSGKFHIMRQPDCLDNVEGGCREWSLCCPARL